VEIGQDICSTGKGKGNGKPLGMPFPEEKKAMGQNREEGRECAEIMRGTKTTEQPAAGRRPRGVRATGCKPVDTDTGMGTGDGRKEGTKKQN